jgi:hypothetical protein
MVSLSSYKKKHMSLYLELDSNSNSEEDEIILLSFEFEQGDLVPERLENWLPHTVAFDVPMTQLVDTGPVAYEMLRRPSQYPQCTPCPSTSRMISTESCTKLLKHVGIESRDELVDDLLEAWIRERLETWLAPAAWICNNQPHSTPRPHLQWYHIEHGRHIHRRKLKR